MNEPDSVDATLPEPVRRFLQEGGRLERIHLDGEGRFTHEGQPFENPRLRALFHRSVDRTEGGTWVLRIPPFVYPIEVEDTPLHVRSLRLDDPSRPEGGAVVLRLSDDTEEPLDAATLSRHPQRGLSCAVKQGRFRARFSRHAAYALAPLLDADDEGVGEVVLRLGGRAWPIAAE